MKRDYDMDTPVFQLTVRELVGLLKTIKEEEEPKPKVKAPVLTEKYVHGLTGISRLFGCSKTTANRIKQSGIINDAITQLGNLIVVDAAKALELVGEANKKGKSHKYLI
jgi:hypothetical protein